MATSGTATFDLDLTEIVEEAFERCGGEMRSGYDLRTARRSLNLLFADWGNRGVNLWTVSEGTINLVAGTATYALPTDTVDLLDMVIRTGAGSVATQQDLTCQRIAEPTYVTIPNKLQQARPIQVWIQRLNTPQITLWPVPDDTQPYQFVYWRLRRIQDAGTGVNTMDMPFRFLPAMIAGLAHYMALKVPGVAPERMDRLEKQYNDAWDAATNEDRDKAPVRFVPRRQYIGRH